MFLRDLLSWRKPAAAVPAAAGPTVEPAVEPALEPTVDLDAVVVAAEPVAPGPGVLHLTTFVTDETEAAPLEPAPEPQPTTAPRPSVVLQRITALRLPGSQDEADRRDAILERLCIVHDPNEVLVSGQDRTARIVMANRRMISARVSRVGRADEVFSFNKRRGLGRVGEEFATSLTGFCAAPGDLVVTEKALTGVFDAMAGLPVDVLLARLGGEPAGEDAEDAPRHATAD